MKRMVVGALAALAFGLAATAADAATWINVTYSGTVTLGTEAVGDLGPIGTVYTGDAFEAEYTFNLANLDAAFGNVSYYGAPGAISFKLGSYALNIQEESGVFVVDRAPLSNGVSSEIQDFFSLDGHSSDINIGFATNGLINGLSEDGSSSICSDMSYCGGYLAAPTGNFLTLNTSSMKVELTSSPLQAIPEPSTWALTLAGFGLTGALLRRRNQTGIA